MDLNANWSREAEKAVLGSMILSDFAADEAIGAMDVEHFYTPAHKMLFGVMKMIRQQGRAIDFVTVMDNLRRSGRLADCGGKDYVLEIAEFVPSPANCLTYAAQVREWWAKRQYVELGKKAESDDSDPEELRAFAEKILGGMRRGQAARSGQLGDFAGLSRKRGIPTGFEFIDSTTTVGGLAHGQMAVVASDTGGGKTAFKTQVAYNVAKAGGRVCFATFADMSARDIADRMTKNLCGWSHEPPKDHYANERYHEAIKTIRGLQIHVYDATEMREHGRDVETFCSWFQSKLARENFDLCIVDYAQELTSREPKARSMFDQAEACAGALRWLAAETGVPMLVGSQITAGNEKQGTKDITMGSRVWMNRAGLLLKLSVLTDEERQKDVKEDQYKAVTGLTVAHLMKNRFGRKNVKAWWRWMPDTASFMELA